VHVAVLDATSHDAAATRFTPDQYAAVQATGWKVRARFRCAPLRLVVWPLIKRKGWGRKFETHLDLSALGLPQNGKVASANSAPAGSDNAQAKDAATTQLN